MEVIITLGMLYLVGVTIAVLSGERITNYIEPHKKTKEAKKKRGKNGKMGTRQRR